MRLPAITFASATSSINPQPEGFGIPSGHSLQQGDRFTPIHRLPSSTALRFGGQWSEEKIDEIAHRIVVDPVYTGTRLVTIDAKRFDEAFRRTSWQYIGPRGTGNAIGKRYQRFQKFLETEFSPLHASCVAVKEIPGHDNTTVAKVLFENGRHRYAVYRDHGMQSIPVSMDRKSMTLAKKHGLLAESTTS